MDCQSRLSRWMHAKGRTIVVKIFAYNRRPRNPRICLKPESNEGTHRIGTALSWFERSAVAECSRRCFVAPPKIFQLRVFIPAWELTPSSPRLPSHFPSETSSVSCRLYSLHFPSKYLRPLKDRSRSSIRPRLFVWPAKCLHTGALIAPANANENISRFDGAQWSNSSW